MDLFNNPMVNNALKSMTPEQLSNYKKIGAQMYGSVDFVDSKIISNLDPPMEESLAYVESGLQSGLLPCDLTEDEVVLLTNARGEEWYLAYGFSKEEVPEPGLSIDMKNVMEEAIKNKIAQETAQAEKRQKKKDKKKKK